MATRRKNINNGNIGGTGDFKVQLASDNSGQYVEVVALDADVGINIGSVTQGTSPWIVQQPDNRAIDQTINSANLNAAVTVTLNGGEGEVGFTITGLTASTATITFEGSNNVAAAVPVWSAINALTGSTLSTTSTTDGNYRVATGGRTAVRVRVSIVGTGTIKVSYSGSSASSLVALATSIPAGSNTIGGVTLPNVETTLTAGAAPSKMVVGGVQYNSTLPTPSNGQTVAMQADSSGRAIVVQPDISGTGTINSANSNAAYTISLGNGEGVVSFAVSGLTASGATLTVEASDDGATWFSINGIAPSTGLLFSTFTTDQSFRINSGGRQKARLRVSGTGTGTITVVSNAATVSSAVALSSPIPAGTNTIGTVLVGQTGADGSTTITLGGSAQNLFAGATPANGFEICNPDATNDLWVSDSTTAAANNTGSYRVAANGGTYTTPSGYKPIGAVSIVGAITAQKITARKW